MANFLKLGQQGLDFNKSNPLKPKNGDAGYRTPYLSHAKRALYRLSYIPVTGNKAEKNILCNARVNGRGSDETCMSGIRNPEFDSGIFFTVVVKRLAMDDNGGSKSNTHGGISPAINKRLTNIKNCCDSDDESCHSPGLPPDVPKGYLAVYVGQELRRFIIPTSCLSHFLFKALLDKSEEEFGFDHSGGLTIPCEIETFKFLMNAWRTILKITKMTAQLKNSITIEE
ncbi:hypothetical protein GH714_028107 [Hevea brasiliensis]|uniref:SAUR family protein n=1 Tax=Hevea brasiliensis TaxID=3981 RepID=A0A6A6LVI4_HEVBR|nr:hypothetical protein GH714_028107 [Hevea brasiliensis]